VGGPEIQMMGDNEDLLRSEGPRGTEGMGGGGGGSRQRKIGRSHFRKDLHRQKKKGKRGGGNNPESRA